MDSKKFSIKRITSFNNKTLKELNHLLLQISSRKFQMTPNYLKSALKNKNVYIMGLYSEKNEIIGMATLIEIFQVNGHKGYIEDVVVDEEYRGRGLGKKIILSLVQVAKKLKMYKIELKSESHRKIANTLYKNVGFEKKEANVYQMVL